MARATREQPSTTKKAMVFLRLAICTVSNGDCTAKKQEARGATVVQLRFGVYGLRSGGAGRQRPCASRERARRVGATESYSSAGASARGIFPRESPGHDGLIGALNFGNFRGVDFLGDADFFQRPDDVPVEINFIPGQAVARGNRMRVMIVVPAFAPGDQRDPPAIGGKIAGLKAARAPAVRGGIHQPGGVQADNRAQENSPQDERDAADGEQNQAENDHRHVMIFGDPDVEFIFGEVGDVTRERGGVMVHGFARQNPAHVRPPGAVHGRMRIAFLIGKLMVNAVRGHPENRAAFESERRENGQDIFQPFGNFVSAMREQAVIAHADAQAGGDPPEKRWRRKKLSR